MWLKCIRKHISEFWKAFSNFHMVRHMIMQFPKLNGSDPLNEWQTTTLKPFVTKHKSPTNRHTLVLYIILIVIAIHMATAYHSIISKVKWNFSIRKHLWSPNNLTYLAIIKLYNSTSTRIYKGYWKGTEQLSLLTTTTLSSSYSFTKLPSKEKLLICWRVILTWTINSYDFA